MNQAATAVDFLAADHQGMRVSGVLLERLPRFNALFSSRRRLAVGTEAGTIHILQTPLNSPDHFDEILVLDQRHVSVSRNKLSCVDPSCSSSVTTLNHSVGHVDHVQRLAWRPSGRSDGGSLAFADLATCSEDRSIRIVRIPFV